MASEEDVLLTEDYGEASLADAHYSGADFSGPEGQALLNGRHHWYGRYGRPSHRAGGKASAQSHYAGREGHRWGWLIKCVGWQRAQQIAALPPRQRVKVIAQLRKAAIQAYQQIMQRQAVLSAEMTSADPEFAPAAGQATHGAMGAMGVTNPQGEMPEYLGDPALFMGA